MTDLGVLGFVSLQEMNLGSSTTGYLILSYEPLNGDADGYPGIYCAVSSTIRGYIVH